MSKKNAQERRRYWLEKINDWKASGESGFSWCKENNINNKAFYRWRSILLNPIKSSLELKPDSVRPRQPRQIEVLII